MTAQLISRDCGLSRDLSSHSHVIQATAATYEFSTPLPYSHTHTHTHSLTPRPSYNPPANMEATKQYLRQQLCPPPATVIQKLSKYMDAEAKLLAQHRASDAKLLAALVAAHAQLLQKHTDARATLLSSFSAPVGFPVVVATAVVLARFVFVRIGN